MADESGPALKDGQHDKKDTKAIIVQHGEDSNQ